MMSISMASPLANPCGNVRPNHLTKATIREKMPNTGKDVEKREHFTLGLGMQTATVIMKNTVKAPPKTEKQILYIIQEYQFLVHF